jgi:hypothetical protein
VTAKSQKRQATAERRRQVCQLRVQGYSPEEICTRLGLEPHVVKHDLDSAYPEYVAQEARAEFKKWHLARCDYYLTCLDERIKEGDDRAVMAALKVLEREAKVLGLDEAVPQKVDLNVGAAGINVDDPDQVRARLQQIFDERKQRQPS